MRWIAYVTAVAVIAAGAGTGAAYGESSPRNLAGSSGNGRLAVARAVAGSDSALEAAGSADTQAPVGEAGAPAPVVVAGLWVAYRSFRFGDGRADIRAVDEWQVIDITAHLARNPSLRFGIDDSVRSEFTNAGGRNLAKRRVAAVRAALIQAGTPAYRIEMGAFADPQRRRNRQVGLFLITAQ